MQVTRSVEFMQVLRWYFVTGMLVYLFVTIMQVTVSIAIIQLEFLQHIAGDRFCSKYVCYNFCCN